MNDETIKLSIISTLVYHSTDDGSIQIDAELAERLFQWVVSTRGANPFANVPF